MRGILLITFYFLALIYGIYSAIPLTIGKNGGNVMEELKFEDRVRVVSGFFKLLS